MGIIMVLLRANLTLWWWKMSKKELFSDARWHDHPTIKQLKKTLSDFPDVPVSKQEKKKRQQFLAELKKWSEEK